MAKYTYISEAGDSIIERHYDSARAPSKIMHDGRPHWIALLYGAPAKREDQPVYEINWPGLLVTKSAQEMRESERKLAGLTYGDMAQKIMKGEI